jgi:hypothetical protein
MAASWPSIAPLHGGGPAHEGDDQAAVGDDCLQHEAGAVPRQLAGPIDDIGDDAIGADEIATVRRRIRVVPPHLVGQQLAKPGTIAASTSVVEHSDERLG